MAHIFISKMKQHPQLVEQMLESPKLSKFMKALDKISSSDEAILTWETGNYAKFEDEDAKSWTCFGFGTEMIAEIYLKMYGPSEHNIIFDRSVMDDESSEVDTGTDHFGFTVKNKDYSNGRRAMPGAKVYIQTKGTLNHSKEHTSNDGSRILNFLATAQSDALMCGAAYSARYVVVTTAKGLHHVIDNNTNKMMEVIHYTKLSKMIDNNWHFWNQVRREFGLPEVTPPVQTDPIFNDNLRQSEVAL